MVREKNCLLVTTATVQENAIILTRSITIASISFLHNNVYGTTQAV